MKKMKRTILYRHVSGWLIVVEHSGFPNENYCLFKAIQWSSEQNLPAHGVGYCNGLESALSLLFHQLIIENVTKARDYQGSMQDLRGVIEIARKEVKELFKVKNDNETS